MNHRPFLLSTGIFKRGPLKIAGLYLLIGSLWILFSDRLAARMATDQAMLTAISIYKGWGYVLITAILLYWLILRDTAATQRSEEQLRLVTDALPVLISYVDAARQYRFANQAYEEWFGHKPLGKHIETVLGTSAYKIISSHVDKVLSGEIVGYETEIPYKDGGARFVNAMYIPDVDADGKVKGFFALVQDITERKESAEQLRLWADAFEGCAHGISIGDPITHRIVVCNPAFAAMHKCRVEEMSGTGILSMYAPSDHAHVRRNVEKADQLGHASFEARMIRKDGSTFPVQMDLVSVLGEDGELLYRVATAQDITERKQAEEENQSLARFPAENPNPILRSTQQGKIVYANPASKLLLRDWHSEVGGYLPPDWINLISELIHTGSRKTLDVRCEDTTYSIMVVPIPDSDYVNLYGRDITERKQAETALNESIARFRTLFEASPDAILLIDPRDNWPILDCNTAACQMNGYTRNELIGQSIDILNPNPWASANRDEYLARIRREGILRYETPHRRKNGTEFPIEVSTSLISLGGRDVLLGIDRDITERKQAEKKLRSSEERYRYLFENNPHPMWVYDRKALAFLAVNEAAIAKYGYSHQEFLNMTIVDIRPPEDADRLMKNLAQPRQPLEHSDGWRHLLKDGTLIDVEITSHTVEVDGNESALVIAQDVTDRKRAEMAIRESEMRYHHILDAMMEGCQIIDFDWRYVYVNTVLAEQGKHKPEELVHHTMMEMYPGIERTELFTILQQCMQERTPRRLENHFVFPDGRIGWFELSIQPAREGIFILSTDITERKRAQEELQKAHDELELKVQERTAALSQTNALLQALMDYTPDHIYFKDTQSRFIRNSKSQASMLGLGDPAEAVGKTDFDFFPHAARSYDEEQEVMRSGQPLVDLEEWVVWPDGRETWVSTTKVPLPDSDGQIIGIFGISRDITERKRAEQAIQQLNADLEKQAGQLRAAIGELEAFSYSVSHDLRAPLRAIDGFTRILVEDYESSLDAEGRRVCGVISKEARRMGELIDDLLAFSRLSRKEMRAAAIDMQTLASSVFHELATETDKARIEFQIGSLPPVAGDPKLIRQVWVNLLSNAIKFTSREKRAVIEVGSMDSRSETIYYVRDNGTGFDMRYAGKLFGVFQRLHSENEFEGTGVGLAIVQRVVHRHGGRVWAEGELEKGATFYFALPPKEDHDD